MERVVCIDKCRVHADLEFREGGFFLIFGVPHPLPVITNENTPTCHIDLGKFPFDDFVMKENEAIEKHFYKCHLTCVVPH